MKRLIMVAGSLAVLGAVFLYATSIAMAGVPKGQLGYEGKPGNQGGWNQAGTKSYEGQPGNQSHN